MGEFLRRRVLLALRLSNVWVELEALSVRLRRVEMDLEQLAEESAPPPPSTFPPPRSLTLRAAPPPPPPPLKEGA